MVKGLREECKGYENIEDFDWDSYEVDFLQERGSYENAVVWDIMRGTILEIGKQDTLIKSGFSGCSELDK